MSVRGTKGEGFASYRGDVWLLLAVFPCALPEGAALRGGAGQRALLTALQSWGGSSVVGCSDAASRLLNCTQHRYRRTDSLQHIVAVCPQALWTAGRPLYNLQPVKEPHKHIPYSAGSILLAVSPGLAAGCACPFLSCGCCADRAPLPSPSQPSCCCS